MSVRSGSFNLIDRIALYMLAFAVGAWLGWHFGLRHEFSATDRPAATRYVGGYLLYEVGLCDRRIAPFPYPPPCVLFSRVNQIADDPATDPEKRQMVLAVWSAARRIALRWMPGCAIALPLLLLFLSIAFGPDSTGWRAKWFLKRKGKWIRGARLVSRRKLSKMVRDAWGGGLLKLGGVRLPVEIEPYHFLMLGSTGQGKSVAFMLLLDLIRDRGDRAVIADAGGEFLSRYGFDPDRGDLILNPLDARSVRWSPLAEIRSRVDLADIARALIPDAFGEAAEWHRYAQIFIADVLRRAYAEDANNGRIVQMATVTDLPKLRKLLANSPAAGLGAENNERMFGSVRGVVTTYITPLGLCHEDAGRNAFSIRRWVTDGRGWAYVNYRDSQLANLKYLIGTMLDVASSGILDLPKNAGRQIWLALDEVASLGRIQSLQSFLTLARKHRGCVMLGLQSNAQLRQSYGPEAERIILSSLSNKLMLAVNDPDTAEYASRTLGDAEYARKVRSGGKSDDGAHQGWNYEYRVSPVALPSEIASQPVRQGYLTLAGVKESASVKLPIPEPRDSGCEPFVARTLPAISLEEFAPPASESGASSDAEELPDFGSNDDGDAS